LPEINKETKNSQSLRKHVKQLKELHQSLEITLTGNIEDIMANPQEWAEKFAEDTLMNEVPRYLKAKTLGENFAREITD
tara:strand:+ start:29 stop:265 length:237 start_codon:yes stop_codon:yes gene_type:complete